jgi:hypothetical protein
MKPKTPYKTITSFYVAIFQWKTSISTHYDWSNKII